MAAVENFDEARVDAQKATEQVHVVEQRAAKAGCSVQVILGNVGDNFGEIVERSLREE